MNRQIWGVALFVLGLLVITDGVLGVLQQNTGTMRMIYIGLGILLVVRGLYTWWSSIRRRNND